MTEIHQFAPGIIVRTPRSLMARIMGDAEEGRLRLAYEPAANVELLSKPLRPAHVVAGEVGKLA